ncbi:shikimate kinase [Desulfotomaculum defluvii]
MNDKANIILIGFMGSGKSSVGSMLSKELGYEFIDMDKEIEKTTKMDIPSIFKNYGELCFRLEETALLKVLCSKQKTVISTGGGTPMNDDNWQIIKNLGLVIHLYVTLDTAIARTGGKDRPMLKQDKSQLEKMWLKRQLIYNLADHTVDTEYRNIEEITQQMLNFIKTLKG